MSESDSKYEPFSNKRMLGYSLGISILRLYIFSPVNFEANHYEEIYI